MSANDNELDRNEALENLTDEERAAIAEDELTDEQRAALEEIADDGEDDDGDDDDASGAADGDVGEEGAAAVADDEGEDDGQAEASAGDEDEDDDFTPTFQFNLPEDFDDQVKTLDDAEADLSKRFKAGDIEADEFIAENRKIADERRKLDAMRTKAEIATDMSTQTVEQQWHRKMTRFMSKPRDGIDYMKDDAARGDFDAALKTLGNNPAYNDKGFDWFIDRAHKMAVALHEPADKGAKPKPAAAAKPADKGKPAARKPKVDKIPANLANVPGGDGPGDVQDEFSDIDNLDGLEYERALAKMTPAQRERYLASA